MKKRKYPTSLFIGGTILNLIKRWYIGTFALVLYLFRIFFPAIPLLIPTLVLLLWGILAIVMQIRMRKAALECDSEVFDELFQTDIANDWKGNVFNFIEKRIEEQDGFVDEHEKVDED